MRNSTAYIIAGPKTFRLASRKILGRWGGNLQNIEKGQRIIYVPDKGMKFVQVDQAGAEALVMAYCCKKGNYRRLFELGIKVHTFVAMHVFEKVWAKKMLEARLISDVADMNVREMCEMPIEDLPSHPMWNPLSRLIKSSDDWSLSERYYFMAKQICHSSNYGIGPYMFRMNTLDKSGGKVVIEEVEAKRLLGTYHNLFPEIQGYHRWVQECVEQNHMLYNLHGHPYTITHYEILDTHWKELYSWVPQSTVGEITNIAYSRMYEYIKMFNKSWDILANTHDSYLLQCPDNEIVECAKKAKEFIEQWFMSPIDGVRFQMKSEAQSGGNWSPFKQDKNPDGLQEIKDL